MNSPFEKLAVWYLGLSVNSEVIFLALQTHRLNPQGWTQMTQNHHLTCIEPSPLTKESKPELA